MKNIALLLLLLCTIANGQEVLQLSIPGKNSGELDVILVRPDKVGVFSYKSNAYVSHENLSKDSAFRNFNVGIFISGNLKKSEADKYDLDVQITKISLKSWDQKDGEYMPSFDQSSIKTTYSLRVNENAQVSSLLKPTKMVNGIKVLNDPFAGATIKILQNDYKNDSFIDGK